MGVWCSRDVDVRNDVLGVSGEVDGVFHIFSCLETLLDCLQHMPKAKRCFGVRPNPVDGGDLAEVFVAMNKLWGDVGGFDGGEPVDHDVKSRLFLSFLMVFTEFLFYWSIWMRVYSKI